MENTDLELPAVPLVDHGTGEDPPSTPPGLVTNDLDLGNLLDDQRDPPPGADFNEGPPGSPNPGSDDGDSLPDSDDDPLPESEPEEGPPPPDNDPGDEDPPPSDSDEDEAHVTLEKMKLDSRFIEMAKEATLESQFTPAELRAFQDPQEVQSSPSDDPDLHLSLRFYISSLDHNQSQKAYSEARLDVQDRFPESKMLSYDQVKRRASDLSGLVTWKHDMCVNSCVGFTGPFTNLEVCPYSKCQEPRYDQDKLTRSNGKNKVPRKVFTTFALGPQLQAQWKNPQTAERMLYRRRKTREELLRDRDADDYVYDNIFCGSAYLKAVRDGEIKDEDMVVMLSIDGAQLFRNKKSDCWMYIWILLDLAPHE
jgi:hypothetical protein